jgi:D-3-phosphoglycerate dehydrogenase
MHIVISDDHQDCIRSLAYFEKLKTHTVEIFNDSVSDLDSLAQHFQNADAIVLIRERAAITKELLDRFPKLKLISQKQQSEGDAIHISQLHQVLPQAQWLVAQGQVLKNQIAS